MQNRLQSGAWRTILLVLVCGGIVSSTPVRATTYTTNFPATENPMSEGGHWLNGFTTGLDWGDMSTAPGRVTGHSGPARLADATALLKGNWGADQWARATVVAGTTHGAPEVELRLRSSLSANRCTGYEISERVAKDGSGYLIIVRWNGALADFTYLTRLDGKRYSVTTGDVVQASIIGHTITAYKNGIELAHVTDDTYKTGNPGIGFNEGSNGDYGFASFTASDDLAGIESHKETK